MMTDIGTTGAVLFVALIQSAATVVLVGTIGNFIQCMVVPGEALELLQHINRGVHFEAICRW